MVKTRRQVEETAGMTLRSLMREGRVVKGCRSRTYQLFRCVLMAPRGGSASHARSARYTIAVPVYR
jgi:hypothetical protein